MKVKHILPAVALTLFAIACSSNNGSRPAAPAAPQGVAQQAGVSPTDQLVANSWCAMLQDTDSVAQYKYTFERDGLFTLIRKYPGDEGHTSLAESFRWEFIDSRLKLNGVDNMYEFITRGGAKVLRLQDSEEGITYLSDCEGSMANSSQAELAAFVQVARAETAEERAAMEGFTPAIVGNDAPVEAPVAATEEPAAPQEPVVAAPAIRADAQERALEEGHD